MLYIDVEIKKVVNIDFFLDGGLVVLLFVIEVYKCGVMKIVVICIVDRGF